MLLIELLVEQMQKNEKLQQSLLTLQTLSLNVLSLRTVYRSKPEVMKETFRNYYATHGCQAAKVPLLYKKVYKIDQD